MRTHEETRSFTPRFCPRPKQACFRTRNWPPRVRIWATRNISPNSNATRHLREYRRDWDDKLKVYKDSPRHDWAPFEVPPSHGGSITAGFQELFPERLPGRRLER